MTIKLLSLSILFLFCSSIVSVKNNEKSISKPLKILVVLGKFPWFTKGPIINQITGLLDQGYDVYIYATRNIKTENMDPKIEKYGLLERTYYVDLPPDLDTYDMIMCQYGGHGKDFVALKNSRKFKAKIIVFFRGADVTSYKMASNAGYRDLFKIADLILPVCKYFKYRLELLGCDLSKIIVHHSAIDCERYHYKKRILKKGKKIKLLSVNRLDSQKGMEFSVRAVAKLIKKYPEIRYVIVGDGTEKERTFIENLICELSVQNNIKLVGWKKPERVVCLLQKAHIFILPSVTKESGVQEGIPNVLKEAMATGMPVISTYHSGIIELVEQGISGFLVPERDVNALASKIEFLIKNSHVWAKMGLKGRRKVLKEFETKKVNTILFKLINKLFKNKGCLYL